MTRVQIILNSLNKTNLKIVETGNLLTKEIAQWVSKNPESDFISVDLDFQTQLQIHGDLENNHIARYCRFLTQTHEKVLSDQTWADIIFLYPYDLQSGLVEFLLAVSTGTSVIVLADYQTRAAFAVKRALEIGWSREYVGSLIVLRRP